MQDGAAVLSGARCSRRVRGLSGSSTCSSIPKQPRMGNWRLLSPLVLVLSVIGVCELKAMITIGFMDSSDS